MEGKAQRVSTEKRSEIIGAVKTPLAFFALAVIIAEAAFGALAIFNEELRTILVVSMILLIFSLVFVVAWLAVKHPEALRGERRPEIDYDNELKLGDHVVLIATEKRTIISELGVISWNGDMSSYVGRCTVITKIERPLRICRVSIDSEKFDWHFDWVRKLPNSNPQIQNNHASES